VRIVVVGGAGTIGTAVVELRSARHDVVVAGRHSGDVQVDETF
jgi:nucleoside-diphosphate-sugar epimerase